MCDDLFAKPGATDLRGAFHLAGEVVCHAPGFDGAAHDFQLLVAENENAGFIGTTPYYFWVEMS